MMEEFKKVAEAAAVLELVGCHTDFIYFGDGSEAVWLPMALDADDEAVRRQAIELAELRAQRLNWNPREQGF